MQIVNIYGYNLKYEDDMACASNVINYLQYDLSQDEAKVFFEQAKSAGSVEFEDDYEDQMTMVYNRGEDNFTLIKRDY